MGLSLKWHPGRQEHPSSYEQLAAPLRSGSGCNVRVRWWSRTVSSEYAAFAPRHANSIRDMQIQSAGFVAADGTRQVHGLLLNTKVNRADTR